MRSVAIRASKQIFSSSIPPITMLLFPRRTTFSSQAALRRRPGQPEQCLPNGGDQHRGRDGLWDPGGGDRGHHQTEYCVQRQFFTSAYC